MNRYFSKLRFSDICYALMGGVSSVFLGSYLLTGGFIPEFSYPLTYSGDGLQFLLEVQRLIEGNLFFNNRSGFPFGSSFADFGTSEDGHLLILKVLGKASRSSTFALNGYIYFSFILNFLSTYTVCRLFKINQAASFLAASLFNFIPFHVQRIEHLFYVLYFHIPIYFYISFKIFSQDHFKNTLSFIKKNVQYLIILFFLAFFGLYYAVFGCILFISSGIASAAKNKSIKSLTKETLCIIFICLGVLTNLTPSIVYKLQNGTNSEVANRHFSESEEYALKLSHLILPKEGHRITPLSKLRFEYNSSAPLCNENSTATLGIVGSCGFIILLVLIITLPFSQQASLRLSFFAVTTYFMFITTTIGGLSVVFSLIISPLIRGWNRISPFIAFSSIASFCIIFEELVKKVNSKKLKLFLTIALLCIGILDLTSPPNKEHNKNIKNIYNNDRSFVQEIEETVAKKSAIFQYPYTPFPEWHHQHQMRTYDLSVGFLHSKNLRWNYAGMKGRAGDLFYKSLNNEPYEIQLDIIKKLGFQGVYIDTAAYKDNGKEIIETFSTLIGMPPTLISGSGRLVFFKINNTTVKDFDNLTPHEIMTKIGYVVDKYGKRYDATLSEGIDFTRQNFPDFIKDVKGLSDYEPWGRWSKSKNVVFEFATPLPKNFNLKLKANVFDKNIGKELKILIGNEEFKITLDANNIDHSVAIKLNEESNKIIFVIPNPQQPKNGDRRKIGLGFVSLKVEGVK